MTNNKSDRYKSYWQTKTSSGHRGKDPNFYQRKAIEQAACMTPEERSGPCLDLGCGAGELLEHLSKHVNVTVGLDYSDSMLEMARRRLGNIQIKLVNADLFAHVPYASELVWITTGAINQYLAPADLTRFLRAFRENPQVRSLFLFDCVDPLRFATLPYGPSYLPSGKARLPGWRAWLVSLRWRINRVTTGVKLMLGLFDRPGFLLNRGRMGYGYHPHHWRELIEQLDLECEVVSSLLYEYRFHVIVRKHPNV